MSGKGAAAEAMSRGALDAITWPRALLTGHGRYTAYQTKVMF